MKFFCFLSARDCLSLLLFTKLDGREAYVRFVETYVFADWKFLTFLGVLVMVDTLLHMINSYRAKKMSSKIIGLLFHKLLLYSCFLILVHILAHYTIEGKPNDFFGWFDNVAYAALIVRESISVLENMGAIRPGLIPDWILKKLKQYDKEGRFEAQPTQKIPE